jgi:hypothetical protein
MTFASNKELFKFWYQHCRINTIGVPESRATAWLSDVALTGTDKYCRIAARCLLTRIYFS